MSIIRRAFAVGFCASFFLLGGCTTNVQQPADLFQVCLLPVKPYV